MAKKVAEQIVETLERAGVKRIYAVTGRTKEVLDTINTNLKHWKEVL